MSDLLKQNKKISPALVATASLLILLVLDTVFFRVASYFYPANLPYNFVFRDFALNLLPVIGFSVIFWLLTARVIASFVLTAALFDAIFFANQLKLMNLGQALIANDFISAVNIGQQGALLSKYFVSAWHPGVLVVLVIASLLLLYFEKPAFSVKLRWRLLTVILLFAAMTTQTATDTLRSAYKPGKDWRVWNPGNNVNNYGLLYNLVHGGSMFTNGSREYDEDRLEAILAQSTNRLYGSGEGLPVVENIVVILSESFFDPADLNGITAGQYDLSAYTELQQRSLTGKITVPAYGGATLRTEFELFTGIDLDLFPDHSYPFISLVTQPINSIAWDFQTAGYSTTGIHPNIGSFWNRDKAYPYLGFERFLDLKEFSEAKRSGYYVADEALTGKLKEEIKDGEKQFVFAISIENHGPWKTGRPNLDADKVSSIDVPDILEGESAITLQQYLYHRKLAESALLELVEDLDSRDSRSIVLFFGDHLPSLEQTFTDLEFKDGRPRRRQVTPFLIYDTHRDLSALQATGSVIDISLLGSILLDLSTESLSEFHVQAERLHFADARLNKAKGDQDLTDLQQLQLWRFGGEPANKRGEIYTAKVMGQPKKDRLAE